MAAEITKRIITLEMDDEEEKMLMKFLVDKGMTKCIIGKFHIFYIYKKVHLHKYAIYK